MGKPSSRYYAEITGGIIMPDVKTVGKIIRKSDYISRIKSREYELRLKKRKLKDRINTINEELDFLKKHKSKKITELDLLINS